ERITRERRVVAGLQLNVAAFYRCSRLGSSLLAKDECEGRSGLSESADNLGSGWIECAFVSDQQLLHLKAKHVVLKRDCVHFKIASALIGTVHDGMKLAVD